MASIPVALPANKSGLSSAYDFTQIFMIQQDMRKGFRRLAVSAARLESGLKRSHDKFYRMCVKQKRADVVRQIDNFINQGKTEDEPKVDQRNSAGANFLTPFRTTMQTYKSKKQAKIQDVTDYTHVTEPIINKRATDQLNDV